MSKFTINMLSSADDVPGQGVASAYIEQVNLVKSNSLGNFDVLINDKNLHEIQHFHTINYGHFLKMKKGGSINISYVHFLPHTLDGSIQLPKMIFDAFKKYIVKFYQSADALVVVNPIFIKELEKYDIDKERIYYIPNYVSKEAFYCLDSSKINAIKDKYDLDLNKKIILGVGQVQTRKGVLDFVEIATKMPDVLFVWSGGFSFGAITDGYKELKDIVDNPPENVKFLGIIPRDEMNDVYNIADVLFMPSYNELFPMAILEAVNSNVPLLLRDLPLYKDILFEKYISGNTNDEFIANIKKLLSDQVVYTKYQNYSKEISEFYSKENVFKQWDSFYNSIYEKYNHKIDFEKINKQRSKNKKEVL